MRITKVVTRQGDDGTTGLVGGGNRVSKGAVRIEACGTVDELSAALGLARALLAQRSGAAASDWESRIDRDLAEIQNVLFTLGAELATPEQAHRPGMPRISEMHITDLEARLASFNAELPPLEEFVLPGGPPPVAALHLARTICRRAERVAVTLKAAEPIGEWVVPFLNRLSDLLFVMARWVCRCSDAIETQWRR